MLTPPGVDLVAAVYGVWRAGGVTVIADRGLGLGGLGRAVRSTRPKFVIGPRQARLGVRNAAVGSTRNSTRRRRAGGIAGRIAGRSSERRRPSGGALHIGRHGPSEGGPLHARTVWPHNAMRSPRPTRSPPMIASSPRSLRSRCTDRRSASRRRCRTSTSPSRVGSRPTPSTPPVGESRPRSRLRRRRRSRTSWRRHDRGSRTLGSRTSEWCSPPALRFRARRSCGRRVGTRCVAAHAVRHDRGAAGRRHRPRCDRTRRNRRPSWRGMRRPAGRRRGGPHRRTRLRRRGAARRTRRRSDGRDPGAGALGVRGVPRTLGDAARSPARRRRRLAPLR